MFGRSATNVSAFSYPISRPYPYRWFTWVVIIGGVCATVFFSFINLAASGYNLKVLYTVDYNYTIGQKRWTQHFPFSIFDKTEATCQSQNLPISSQLFTDKLALTYTLAAVWQEQEKATVMLPSLRYTSNTLENCTVGFVQVDLESADRNAAQQGWVAWGVTAFAQVTCAVKNDKVPTILNLTVSYDLTTPNIETGITFHFLQPPDNQTQASLWWGESLLSWYWLNLVKAMHYNENLEDNTITKGSISFGHNTNVSDITDLDFFGDPSYHFVTDGSPGCCINPAGHDFENTLGNLAKFNVTPNIWIELDSFAKAFYASIMTDLGQTSSETMLGNDTSLDYFTSNISAMAKTVESKWLKAGPARKSYSDLKNVTGPLNVTSSVIYAQYLCQVPELKSGGSLFAAILIADLVFLQALWKILNLGTIAWLERSDPYAKFCEGCLRYVDRSVELAPQGSATATDILPLPSGRPNLLDRKGRPRSTESQQPLIHPT